ncbi:MAG: hypothetical protein P8Y80_02240, partial [Acidobacteriota bacterium]|jgi:hypothetical protein
MDISRRSLFKQAAGSVAFLSVLKSSNPVYGQTSDSTGDIEPRMRDSFDFGWKFIRGDMRSHEDFASNRRKAFCGLCLAVVQAMADPGEIRLTAISPGLKAASATVPAT